MSDCVSLCWSSIDPCRGLVVVVVVVVVVAAAAAAAVSRSVRCLL
jgi:hypothetical protein